MQLMEASKKAGWFGKSYAAMLVIAPESEEHFLTELSHAGGALVDWKISRGSAAKDIRVTIVCKGSLNAWIKTTIVDAFHNTPALAALKNGTEVAVSLLNRGQTPVDEFVL